MASRLGGWPKLPRKARPSRPSSGAGCLGPSTTQGQVAVGAAPRVSASITACSTSE
jgi:hypothetical protein